MKHRLDYRSITFKSCLYFILFSTFLGDFIEYEVQLDDGQNLIVNEYTKDTAEVHTDGEKVHLSFDPLRISLYDVNEEVLSL